MTYLTEQEREELIERAEAVMREKSYIRKGQALFNELKSLHPTLANTVRGTSIDPYYFDDNIDMFLNFILED